jgi:hypothetical protein
MLLQAFNFFLDHLLYLAFGVEDSGGLHVKLLLSLEIRARWLGSAHHFRWANNYAHARILLE